MTSIVNDKTCELPVSDVKRLIAIAMSAWSERVYSAAWISDDLSEVIRDVAECGPSGWLTDRDRAWARVIVRCVETAGIDWPNDTDLDLVD